MSILYPFSRGSLQKRLGPATRECRKPWRRRKGFVRLSSFCAMITPALSRGGSPAQDPQGLSGFSPVGGEGIPRAVPAIGNEPGRSTLPVASAVLARAQDIALFLAFLA